ncbi:peptidoglycan editing factor PgeF [Pseudonocardia xishanensis]|uniref:Purine nucleoside phosphorylase n=1 Tax=Pseudonocardia xishanensis TaxID=630995 RepID=A0ABP8RT95_9PSEU
MVQQTAVRVRRVMTTRAGGRSSAPFDSFNLSREVGDHPDNVDANRYRLIKELGLRGAVFLKQIHGTRVETVTTVPKRSAPDVADTDAAVTAEPGVGLVVLAADCTPVLFGDSVAGVVGAAHAGRVGAAAGVVPATVEAMVALGSRVSDIEVLLGPAVCGLCYEVPEAMRAEVETRLPGSAATSRRGTPSIDVRAGLYRQLRAMGVGRIGGDPRCTLEDRALFSHRRDQRTGRHAGISWLDAG